MENLPPMTPEQKEEYRKLCAEIEEAKTKVDMRLQQVVELRRTMPAELGEFYKRELRARLKRHMRAPLHMEIDVLSNMPKLNEVALVQGLASAKAEYNETAARCDELQREIEKREVENQALDTYVTTAVGFLLDAKTAPIDTHSTCFGA